MARVEGKDADGRGAELKVLALHQKADPSRRQAAAELAVGEDRDGTAERAEPCDDPVGAARDVVRALAAGAPVMVAVPARQGCSATIKVRNVSSHPGLLPAA